MIRRWCIAFPLIVCWFSGTFITAPTAKRTSTSNVVVVMAFTPIPTSSSTTSFNTRQQQQQTHVTSSFDRPNPQHVSSTSLDGTAAASPSMMSPWNINPEFGAPPFGFDMNAEIWNGRVAQVRFYSDAPKVLLNKRISYYLLFISFKYKVSFVWVFLQEFVQGKGVIKGLSDGDIINIISLSVFAVTIIALIGRFLAEPPAGWPTREISVSSPSPQSNVMSVIRSNPMAYAQAKSVETLTKTITATNSDKTILNFNDGTSPFGLKKNAEIWNGRIAMVCW